jgi:DNA-binding NtrC family response regulator
MQHVVAVINTSPDTIDLLRSVLQRAGIVVVSGYTFELRVGKWDIEGFVRQHQPKVVVYDIAPPYEENWRLFEHVRGLDVMANRPFVITSVNPRHVQSLVGRDERVYEVVGKPVDLDQIVQAVKEALHARPTR